MICGAGDAACCLGADGAGQCLSEDLGVQFREFVEQVDKRLVQLELSLSELFERLDCLEEEGEVEEEVESEDEQPRKVYKCYT